jgi:hypothetical protein
MGEYTYRCPKCRKIIVVNKSIDKASKVEYCPFSSCHMPLVRLFCDPLYIEGETSVKKQDIKLDID